jgi:hypothetical protein
MESQLPEGSEEMARLRKRLKDAIRWRDQLDRALRRAEAEIFADARTFATLNGDFVRPTLEQLRRMLFDDPDPERPS